MHKSGGILLRNLTVYFDADDVLVDSTTPGVERYNAEYGTLWTYEDMKNYVDDRYVPEGTSIDKYYDEPGFYRHFKPFPQAQEVIRKLHTDGHTLYIATASDLSTVMDKVGCFDEHFPEFNSIYRNVIPIKHKHLLIGDVLVDDMYYNLENSQCGLKLLVDRPWNRQDQGDFVRVYTFEDIYKEINQYAETLTLV